MSVSAPPPAQELPGAAGWPRGERGAEPAQLWLQVSGKKGLGFLFFFTIYCSRRPKDGAGTSLRPWPSHVPLLHGVQCAGAEEKEEEKGLWG